MPLSLCISVFFPSQTFISLSSFALVFSLVLQNLSCRVHGQYFVRCGDWSHISKHKEPGKAAAGFCQLSTAQALDQWDVQLMFLKYGRLFCPKRHRAFIANTATPNKLFCFLLFSWSCRSSTYSSHCTTSSWLCFPGWHRGTWLRGEWCWEQPETCWGHCTTVTSAAWRVTYGPVLPTTLQTSCSDEEPVRDTCPQSGRSSHWHRKADIPD